ncbi:hypothetical protein [Neptunicella marina]|uniref:Tetratricopeptide repeat protein n=1 Tax=Neptunicella marina TaxID=2125989 RepID=A0A8J6IWI9_9ALTE|nr:hypothetical protein [Neptunicella marina]MBC3766663.1 hypothetical protein [Neptunicella marina]
MMRLLSLLLLVFALAACSSNRLDNQTSELNRVSLADDLEKQGRFYDAWLQWKILTHLDNNNPEYQQNMQNLHNKIKQKSAYLKSRLPANPSEKYKTHYLKLLALEPSNHLALDALRQIQWQQSLTAARQKTKAIKEYFNQVQNKANKSIAQNKYATKAKNAIKQKNFSELLTLSSDYIKRVPDSQLAQDNSYIALTELANQAAANGQTDNALTLLQKSLLIETSLSKKQNIAKINRIKSDKAEHAYKQGLLLFKSNIAQAIVFFKQAINLDPTHYKAQQQLKRAEKIQSNLLKIRRNH